MFRLNAPAASLFTRPRIKKDSGPFQHSSDQHQVVQQNLVGVSQGFVERFSLWVKLAKKAFTKI